MAQAFLDAVAERVVFYDGAFGTYIQSLDLDADDFGGPDLEGCNEHLVLTRPDVIAGMHDAFLAVGVDVVETATFGAFATVLAEYDIAAKAYEINRRAAEIAREVAAGHSADGRAALRGGVDGSRHQAAVARAHHASPTCATSTRSRRAASSTAASTCCSSRPATTCCRPRRP